MLAKLSNFSAIADAPLKKNAVLARQPVLHAGQTPAERFPDNAIPGDERDTGRRLLLRRIDLAATRQQAVLDRRHRRTPA